ncbi:MAG: substrate-binding domain-containing protein [Sulfolobus sp.]|nr:substrate-binding domain-containing protein [Sulfolobus sp.]
MPVDKSRRNLIIGLGAAAALAAAGWGTAAYEMTSKVTKVVQATPNFAQGISIIFNGHWGPTNVFGNAVEIGFNQACELTGAQCKFYRSEHGDANEADIISNLETAINQHPDVLIATYIYDAVGPYLAQASKQGIIVILSNVNAPTPQAFEESGAVSFIGQSLVEAGYVAAQALSKYFPSGSHVAILNEGPGQVWATQRIEGITEFLKEYDCTWDIISSSFNLPEVASQISAYIEANPDTKAILSNGYGSAVVSEVFPKLGINPGQIAVNAFDITPEVLNAILSGYVQLTIDQQPYLQGFLPVIQGILMKKYMLSGWNVNTGDYVITKEIAEKVAPLVKEGIFY